MPFRNYAELVNQVVQGIANTAPSGWTKIVFYQEFLEDEKIGLRNKSTGRCFGGERFDVRLDDCDLGASMGAINSLEGLYQGAVRDGDQWAGVLLTIFSDGQFKCRFYHDNTPLLDNDYVETDKILSEGMKDLPGQST